MSAPLQAGGRVEPGRSLRGVAAPSCAGYLLAVLVSVGVVDTVLVVPLLLDDGPMGFTMGLVLSMVMVLVCAVPFAVPGVVLVHLATLRARAQLVHVLAAGGAGALTGLVLELVIQSEPGWVLPLIVGTATTIGRAAVIPLALPRRHA